MTDEEEEKMKKSLTEVWAVLQTMNDYYIKKLPELVLKVIEEKRDKSYVFKVNPVTGQFDNMSRDGLALFAYLNLEYWSTPKEKKHLIKIYKKNDRKYKLKKCINFLKRLFWECDDNGNE